MDDPPDAVDLSRRVFLGQEADVELATFGLQRRVTAEGLLAVTEPGRRPLLGFQPLLVQGKS
jgi:hypothetical protein